MNKNKNINNKDKNSKVLTGLNKNQITWDRNHTRILQAYDKIMKDGDTPSLIKISLQCKLSRQTVAQHLKDMKLEDVSLGHKLRLNKILNGVAKKAEEEGGINAKLYLQVVWGWSERQKIETDNFNYDVEKIMRDMENDPKAEPFLRRLAAGEDYKQVMTEYATNQNRD